MESQHMADMLAANEESLMMLYKRYAAMFPYNNRLWVTLANAEKGHAELVRLLFKEKRIDIVFDEDDFDPDTILEIRLSVGRHLKENLDKKISYKEALRFALYMERFLNEKELVHYLKTDNADVQKTFDYLERSTQKHIELILVELGKSENEKTEP